MYGSIEVIIMPIGEKERLMVGDPQSSRYRVEVKNSKPIGNLEDAQRRFHIEQAMYWAIQKSFMGLLPMDDYIQTFVEINRDELNEKILEKKK